MSPQDGEAANDHPAGALSRSEKECVDVDQADSHSTGTRYAVHTVKQVPRSRRAHVRAYFGR